MGCEAGAGETHADAFSSHFGIGHERFGLYKVPFIFPVIEESLAERNAVVMTYTYPLKHNICVLG